MPRQQCNFGVSPTSRLNQAESAEHAAVKTTHKQRLVLANTFHQSRTRRELHGLTKIDISSLCAILATLIKKGLIEERVAVECPVTGNMVNRYGTTSQGKLQHIKDAYGTE